MTAPAAAPNALDPKTPFGLPPGSVRGLMSLLICGFFWIVLLLPAAGPDGPPVKPPLGHFFLLTLVFLAFSSSAAARGDDGRPHTLPWLLRLLFVGGSAAVAGFVAVQHPDRFPDRITPAADEVAQWWGPFIGCVAGGFAVGLALRFVLGDSHVFRTLRSWLGVVALVMLAFEIGLFVLFLTSQSSRDFLQLWEAVELAVVAAYFGMRA
jgi:hypothetical protein